MSDARWSDPRECDARDRVDERPRVYDERDRDDHDPRDGLMHDLDLPRGDERELVVERDRVYELDGEDSRALAAVGAFRVVPEHELDLPHDTLENLHDQSLVELVDLGDSERGLTLTTEGRDLLDSHSLNRESESLQVFHAGVSRPREIDHDSNLYATFRQEEVRLRDQHPELEIRRVILEQDLKRAYQEFLQQPTAIAPTVTADLAATRTRSASGRASTICRTSMTRCTSRTTASSTRPMAGNFIRTSNCSRRTTAAPTLPVAQEPAFAFTWSPRAVAAVDPGRVRAGWRNSCDARIPAQQDLRQRQHQSRVRFARLQPYAEAA
jgi:hypothetical protein